MALVQWCCTSSMYTQVLEYNVPGGIYDTVPRAENILGKWGGSSHQQRRVRVYVRAHAIARSWTAGKEVGVLCPLARRSGGAGAPPAPPESPPLCSIEKGA